MADAGALQIGGFSTMGIVASTVFSTIGFVAFVYGKKSKLLKPMIIGGS